MNIRDFYKSIGIGFEITRGCNMRCPYCYVINRPHEGEELTREDWLALSKLLPKCLPGFHIRVSLAGGEVFVKEWVVGVIQCLLEAGIHVRIGTNGLRVPEILTEGEYFRGHSRLGYAISMDGMKAAHETTRLDFDKVWHTMEMLVKNGSPVVVRVTAHRENLKDILELGKCLNEVGGRCKTIIPLEVQPLLIGPRKELRADIAGFQALRLSLEDYLQEGVMVCRYVENHLKFVRTSWRFVGDFTVPKGQEKAMYLESALFGCMTGYGFDVMANGDVAACEMDLPVSNIKNNISEETLLHILELLDKRLVPHPRCVACAYKMSCGMCRLMPLMHGYTEGFGYDDCQPFMRDVLEILADRKPEGRPHHRFHCVS